MSGGKNRKGYAIKAHQQDQTEDGSSYTSGNSGDEVNTTIAK